MFVFLGAIAGVIAFLPLIIGLKASKKVTPKSNFGYGAIMLLSVLASMAILALTVLIFYFCAKDNLLEVALAAAITIIVFAIVYGIYSVIKQKKAAKKRKENSKIKAKNKADNKDEKKGN